MIKNKDGIAFIVALIFTAISMMLIGLALYISTQYTKLSAKLKSYVTSLSAAEGAYSITTKILPLIKYNPSYSLANIPSLVGNREKCLHVKLVYLTPYWTLDPEWSNNNCPTLNNATSANVDDIVSYYDLKYKVGGYYVYIKVTSSSLGNTQTPQNNKLSSGGVTSPKTGVNIINPPKMPHIYRIEIVSEKNGYSEDKVHITTLFAY